MSTDNIKHGTVSGYTNGRCRCPECRAAKSADNKARRDTTRLTGAGDKCGTLSGYTSGCRCEGCRKAGAEYQRKRVEVLAVEGVGDKCGTLSGYTVGCRCVGCRESMSRYQRTWAINNPHKVRAKAGRRHQAIRQVGGEKIDIEVLTSRDNGLCCLCGHPVVAGVRSGHPLRGTVEHLTPVTRDGETSYVNCALAHHSCNASKGDRTLEEFLADEHSLPESRRRSALVATMLIEYRYGWHSHQS